MHPPAWHIRMRGQKAQDNDDERGACHEVRGTDTRVDREGEEVRNPRGADGVIKENGIELTDGQLKGIAGGTTAFPWAKECPKNPNGDKHGWVPTGRTKPGKIFGDL